MKEITIEGMRHIGIEMYSDPFRKMETIAHMYTGSPLTSYQERRKIRDGFFRSVMLNFMDGNHYLEMKEDSLRTVLYADLKWPSGEVQAVPVAAFHFSAFTGVIIAVTPYE